MRHEIQYILYNLVSYLNVEKIISSTYLEIKKSLPSALSQLLFSGPSGSMTPIHTTCSIENTLVLWGMRDNALFVISHEQNKTKSAVFMSLF